METEKSDNVDFGCVSSGLPDTVSIGTPDTVSSGITPEIVDSFETRMKTENKVKRFVIRLAWNARRAGGLFLGFRLSFPSNVLFDDGSVRSSVQVSAVFWSLLY